MEFSRIDAQSSLIRAHSERQAMDWSLVLVSQDIPTTIQRFEDNQWMLVVDLEDRDRALQAIRQFRVENRRWVWRQQIPGWELTFHWGGVFWCLLLIVIYRFSVVDFPVLYPAGVFSSTAVAAGEWWRLFTPMLLHADLPHLLFNAITGFILFGLAMAKFGPGCGLLGSYLAGAVGFVGGLALYKGPYQGLGASGMVMGALGLITIRTLPSWRMGRLGVKQSLRGFLAGMLLFVLLGTGPKTDVVAHLGGFVSGLGIGGILHLFPARWIQSRIVSIGSWVVLVGLVLFTGWLALFHA